MNEKTCLFCKHFVYDAGSRGYSEWTPGWDVSMRCAKKHWKWDQEDPEFAFRAKMLKAETCADYEYEEVRP